MIVKCSRCGRKYKREELRSIFDELVCEECYWGRRADG
jgi:DNA-directed RNA polymerase subunit RPC12/RpoP